MGFVGSTEPITLQLYCETLQRFRLAAQGHGAVQPPQRERARVEKYFDPIPLWYESAGAEPSPETILRADKGFSKGFDLHAITQRPMFMYHSWGSQNRWLRQIATRKYLYAHPRTLAEPGVNDGDWAWIASRRGRIRVQVRAHAATAPGSVWTWNALGKKRGAWKLDRNAPEFVDGFLLNDLIGERDARGAYSNADPVTGQAAWFDLRVRLEPDPQPQAPGHRVELNGGDARMDAREPGGDRA
jgi:anaerobic selenocysteine-containing dehydrogenase